MPSLSGQENAKANGVPGLEWLTPAEAKALEPNVHCSGALLSRSSGVIDSHGLMAALLVSCAHFALLPSLWAHEWFHYTILKVEWLSRSMSATAQRYAGVHFDYTGSQSASAAFYKGNDRGF
jgi:hypothetical protein